MAIILTDQELINAKRDIDDIGKAVNQKEVVHPRYGDSFKSLPMIIDEFQISSDAAESAAVSAAESANIAQSSSQIAQDSAALAELSATAATIGGKVYDTPEAGVDPVTGVADGAYFNVRSSNDDSYIDEYQNVGGIAVATGKSYPSSDAVVGIGAAVAEVKEAIIDPVTGDAVASKLKDESGKTQQEINDSLNGISFAPDLPSNRRLRIIAGAIRNTGDGWKWISDNAHTPVGVTPTVTVSGLSVRIDYGFTAKRVVTLLATPDETFAAMALTVGGSVGTSFTNLTVAAPLSFAVDVGTGVVTSPVYRGSYITTSVVNNALVITHPRVQEALSCSVSKVGTGANHSDINVSVGTNQITVYGSGDISGVLTWSGTTWAYLGNMKNPPAVSFENGLLTITHPVADMYTINVSPIAGDNVKLTSRTSTTTTFTVYADDGTPALNPMIGTAFNFSRKANVVQKTRSGLYSFMRGYATIDAADLASSSGNIWIFGVMEVDS